jgi:hypothetical protein
LVELSEGDVEQAITGHSKKVVRDFITWAIIFWCRDFFEGKGNTL